VFEVVVIDAVTVGALLDQMSTLVDRYRRVSQR